MKILRFITSVLFAFIAATFLSFAVQVNVLPVMAGLILSTFLIPRIPGIVSIALFDLAKPVGKNPAAGGGVNSSIILIHEDDIDWSKFPARDADDATISTDIVMKAGKYMHRFYMTQGTIIPSQKKLKGPNEDSGGWELSLVGFYPGMEAAVQKWMAAFGITFKGIIIIQNCSNGMKYLMGGPCNLVHIDAIDTAWGEEVDKEKGSKVTFIAKQNFPMAIYTGGIKYDPGSQSW